ncbi:MAG: AAA family ATPase, partial [Candidatus Tectomicrobia bacterium]|nr:AAA family ATPase [Candidatus Tectomicrobia bacterium]
MTQASQWCFERFRLDLTNACLWHHDQMIALPPKPFAVLTYLVTHAGQLVPKETLFDVVWPETVAGDAVLKTCIRQIRKALGETARSPQFVATVHRRGYRFIAPVTPVDLAPPTPDAAIPGSTLPGADPPRSHPTPRLPDLLVEREAVFDYLHDQLEQARRGERQVVFLLGEAGFGKTAVVDDFIAQVASDSRLLCVRSQCVEQFGLGEAYMPVLEAIGQLCRGPAGPRIVTLLHRQAPTWLVQMPWLLSPSEREQLRRELNETTRERMLRELAEALETLTVEFPLVFVLEDLHWGDEATLDLLALLARRQERAQLLLMATSHLPEHLGRDHPLRTVMQTLKRHELSKEYVLAPLSIAAVTIYLAIRFPRHQFPPELASVLHQCTEGNPLFLINMLTTLLDRGMIENRGGTWGLDTEFEAIEALVPEGLQDMIEEQIDHLSADEQRILEVASVAGKAFSVAAVALGNEQRMSQLEAQCEHLARQRHFIQAAGIEEWPDGTVATRYHFTHSLYQHVIYQRMAPGRRIRLHQQMAVGLEAGYGLRAREIAAELAFHFRWGRDVRQAIAYLLQAAETATQRYAHREAIRHLTTGLGLLDILPDTVDRSRQELDLQVALGMAFSAAAGYADPEVERAYTRALQLCEHVEEAPQRFQVLAGLQRFYFFRGQSQKARGMSEELLTQAQGRPEPEYRFMAHYRLGQVLLAAGELQNAHLHFDQGIALYESLEPSILDDPSLPNFVASCHMLNSETLWLSGYPDQAVQINRAGLLLASSSLRALPLAGALICAIRLHTFRREWNRVQQHAEALISLCSEKGFPLWRSIGTMLQGLALTIQGQRQEGLRRIHQGLQDHRHTGATRNRTYYLAVLAEAYGLVGRSAEGLDTLAEALTLVETHDERWWEAELHRLRGELLLMRQGALPVPGNPADTVTRHPEHAE